MKIHALPTAIDLSKVILWQYENAKRLRAIVKVVRDGAELSTVELWKKAFYVFDLDRPILDGDDDYQYRLYGLHSLSNLFGLERPKWKNGGLSSMVSVDVWRRYIKAMIWLMDSDGSCSDINFWLSIIFPNRNSRVIDNFNMTITYRFYPAPEQGDEDWELLHIDGFLPHPAGVKTIVNYINTDAVLGLDDQNGEDEKNLNNSRFGDMAEEGE